MAPQEHTEDAPRAAPASKTVDDDGALERPLDGEEDDLSPIEEVNLTVSTKDDPSLQSLTIRTWFIGIVICVFLSFVNQFFWFRTSPFIISALAGQILSLYIGRFLARVVPNVKIGPVSLNPGPFNVKEHVLITIFANCGSAFSNGNAYAIDIVTLIKLNAFYGQDIKFITAFLLVTTTQVLGYGWAGLLRKYLVYPAHMWWPQNLVNVSLFRTLHEAEPKRGLTRLQFFAIATVASFAWYLLPSYFFATITSLSWICWAWKDSVTAHQLGSGLKGLGLGAIALDWATITAFLTSPLAAPWFSIVNIFVGFVIITYVVIPAVYWTNIYDAKKFPILSSRTYLGDGSPYPIRDVVTSSGLQLDTTKYDAYGPPQLSGFFAVTYGIGFASLTATLSHVALWHGKEIYKRFRNSMGDDKPDVHTRLMRKYPDIPSWWFLVLLVVNIAVSIATLEGWRDILQLQWWAFLMASLLSFIFTLPIGIIAATTNQVPGLNIITEMIYGYLKPGFPIGNACFKTYGYISMTQAVSFLQDFKLGHYMKVPPRPMFLVQVVGTVVAGLTNLGVAYWFYGSRDGPDGNFCNPNNTNWSCPNANTFFSATIIWGLVGPERMFGSKGRYLHLNWFFLFGALAPVPVWLLAKALPQYESFLKKVNFPILIGATSLMPPASPVNYTSWFLMGMIFNYFVFKYRKLWWQRYNYVLSAALDTGVAFAGPLIYLALQYENKQIFWWGYPASGPADHCDLATCPTFPGISLAGCPGGPAS